VQLLFLKSFRKFLLYFPWYGNVATFSYFGDHGQHVDEMCLGDTPLRAGSKRHGSVGDEEQGAAISLTHLCLLGANEQELMRQSEELLSVSSLPCKWSSLMAISNGCIKVHSESLNPFVVESR
jgi:hypothetical protein